MTKGELRAAYEALIATADTEETVLELSRQIRADHRLSNMDRNMLWSACASRRSELSSGKDGSESALPTRRAQLGTSSTSPASVPANPGGAMVSTELVSPSPPTAAGELSLAEAKEMWDKFQAFKMAVIERGDFDDINGKKDLNRSGWSKIGTAFGITVRILDREVSGIGDHLKVSFWVRASKGNRSVDNVGSCEGWEITTAVKPSFHLVETKAYTRAMKRAIADLVGGAEIE